MLLLRKSRLTSGLEESLPTKRGISTNIYQRTVFSTKFSIKRNWRQISTSWPHSRSLTNMHPLSNHSIRGNYVKCALVPNFLPFVRPSFIRLWKGSEELGVWWPLVIMSTMSLSIWKGSEELRDLVLFRICLICLICLFISGVVLSWPLICLPTVSVVNGCNGSLGCAYSV